MITYTVLKSNEELDVVTALITRVYMREGYIRNIDAESGITKYLRNKSTKVFLAKKEGVIIGTISLVADGELGLPMDLIYQDELKPYRSPKHRLAEVCQFAIDTQLLVGEGMGASLEVSRNLLALVVSEARKSECTCVSFTVNPKHKKFYELLGALQIGGEKMYPSVENAPALAYILDIKIAPEAKSAQGNKMQQVLSRFVLGDIATHLKP